MVLFPSLTLAPVALLIWLLLQEWTVVLPSLLGIGVGTLVLLWPLAAWTAAGPLRALARAARPLLLPLLVVIVVGAVNSSIAIQLLISAAVLILGWKLIIEPECGELDWSPIAVIGGRPFRARSFPLARPCPGLPRLRRLTGDDWVALAAIPGLLAALLLGIEVVLSLLGTPEPADNEFTVHTHDLGFGAAVVATAVLGLSTGYGLIVADKRGEAKNPPEEESADARRLLPAATSGDGGLELARRYAPVLVFSEGERWAPSRVDDYVQGATLSGPGGKPIEVESMVDVEREVCRRSGRKLIEVDDRSECMTCPEFGADRCYELSIECDNGGQDCARGRHRETGRLYRDGAVYVRVLRKGERKPEEPRGAFVNKGPFRHKLETLIQYWYFYRYNEWRAPVFAGLLIQRHEGDWEAVTIGFDKQRQPLFVADSAHCAGSWRNWKRIEASTRLPGPRTHPLVAVAEGSHANYGSAGQKRSPDWASCAGAPAGVTTAIGYASNIRDKTGFGWYWYPPRNGWVQVTPKVPPMNFPGIWGADDLTTLHNFKSTELGDGKAPATPSLQPLWRKPVQRIFCGKFEPEKCIQDEK